MSYTHFSMGALNKNTHLYEYPRIASKKYKYRCPCCEKDVIFKHGKIKQPHFSHYKSDTPCHYYDSPNETQIHKDAKLLMKSLLNDKKQISVDKVCLSCNKIRSTPIVYTETTRATIEHKFYYNDSLRSADVALIDETTIHFIFEICYKHKTKEENRPEPWIEIDAIKLINNINSVKNADETDIHIQCIRDYKCDTCIYTSKKYNDWLSREEEKKRIQKEDERKRKEEQELKRKEEQELKRKEDERKLKEEQELQKQYEAHLKRKCKCDIMLIHICSCEEPQYELIKLSNNMWCGSCCKWKCRC